MLALSVAMAAQTPSPAQPAPCVAAFTVFSRGADVGREEISLARAGAQWIITSTGKIGEFTINRLELKYTADWQPVENSAAAVDDFLRDAKVRPWQRELTVPVFTEALHPREQT